MKKVRFDVLKDANSHFVKKNIHKNNAGVLLHSVPVVATLLKEFRLLVQLLKRKIGILEEHELQLVSHEGSDYTVWSISLIGLY